MIYPIKYLPERLIHAEGSPEFPPPGPVFAIPPHVSPPSLEVRYEYVDNSGTRIGVALLEIQKRVFVVGFHYN